MVETETLQGCLVEDKWASYKAILFDKLVIQVYLKRLPIGNNRSYLFVGRLYEYPLATRFLRLMITAIYYSLGVVSY